MKKRFKWETGETETLKGITGTRPGIAHKGQQPRVRSGSLTSGSQTLYNRFSPAGDENLQKKSRGKMAVSLGNTQVQTT